MNEPEFLMCSECLAPFDPSANLEQWTTTECLYSEDVYCTEHLIPHMKEYHHFYYVDVLHKYTQQRINTVNQAKVLVKMFASNKVGNIIDKSKTFDKYDKQPHYKKHGIYMVTETGYGRVPKFDYYKMSHDNFVIYKLPTFMIIAERGDDSAAGVEAIC